MSKIEKQFKQDFENTVKYDKKFDLSQLETNSKPKKKFNPLCIIIPVATAVVIAPLVPFAVFLLPSFDRESSVKEITRKYSAAKLSVLENNTFRKINNPTLPMAGSLDSLRHSFNEEELEAYNSFSDKIFKDLDKNSNSMFSPISLYSVLNSLSNSVSDTDTEVELDNLLELSQEKRNSFYKKAYLANSFKIDGVGNIEIHNGAFFTNEVPYSQEYVDTLTDLYTECFQLDYMKDSDINNLLTWAKERMRSDKLSAKDIGIKQDHWDAFTLLSTLYFNTEWRVIFEKENFQKDFYLQNGDKVQANFMEHEYMIHDSYQYDDYYSFSDSYSCNATINYIVPRNDKTIYDIVENYNIFENSEENLIPGINPETYREIAIDITMPEFKLDNEIDFESIMKNNNCGNMFDDTKFSFNNAFDHYFDRPVYVRKLFQKNSINLNKKGTEVKTVTTAHMGFGKAGDPHMMDYLDVYEVVLDKPFGYVIKDLNGIALYAGIVDNPLA